MALSKKFLHDRKKRFIARLEERQRAILLTQGRDHPAGIRSSQVLALLEELVAQGVLVAPTKGCK